MPVARMLALGLIGSLAVISCGGETPEPQTSQKPSPITPPSIAPAVPVSQQCEASLLRASRVPIDESVSAAIHESVVACDSVAEWLTALRMYPDAMGLKGPEFVGQIDIEIACSKELNRPTPVCLDAVELGIPIP